MNRRTLSGLVVGGLVVTLAAAVAAQSALASLGLREASARGEVLGAFESGYVPVYQAAKAFKAAAPATRASLVTGLLTWVKAYTETPAFKADYDRRRQEDAPTPPTSKGSADQQLAKQRAEQQKGIDEMKANLKNLPPDMQKQMAETVKQLEAQMAAMAKDPQMQAMMRQGAEMQAASDQKAYEDRVKAHEKRFPPDHRTMIARRLREFLATSQTVDYSAKLVPARGKMVFADPRYEEKPAEWKLCYRAGKEAVDAARAFATDWLRQLEAK